MNETDKDKVVSRIGEVWGATLANALTPGGATDRKTLIEQYQGRPRQQLDLTNDDDTLFPALLRVFGVKPADAPSEPSTEADPAEVAKDETR
jgi:hypothetical protein